MNSISVSTVTPITVEHPGLAVATARAGAVAWLDAGLCSSSSLPLARRNLRSFLDLAPEESVVGILLRGEQIDTLYPLLEDLAPRRHRIAFCEATAAELAEVAGRLPAGAPRELWATVTSLEAALDLASSVDGLIACGQECGGFVGEDSAFILAQKLSAAALGVPFHLRGGIGLHTVGACMLAGAAGVVLDDQLWLMPESPLSPLWRRYLREADGQEAVMLGDDLGLRCRVFFRRDLEGACRLRSVAEELARAPHDEAGRPWRRRAMEILGWGTPGESALPMGQAVGLASRYRQRFHTTGRLIQALQEAGREHLAAAGRTLPLAAGSPLARSHNTRYPLVQGPMTRVSDSPLFAAAVADAGALPLLALAMMGEDAARTMLRQTRERLGDRPWGVGILGFVSAERREEQLVAIAEVRPPFALIAGGRPDQAAALESRGVATYLHVPVPGLLRRFIEQGARRFVFEGRECGGHIGPLSSFVLWESMVEALLEHTPARELEKVHVLFAGGIHDALSGAMVSAIAAPLAERGVRVGALLGTAYLFTEEAVASGAISASFQREALECTDTVELRTGLGHTIRCAPTPFAEEFQAVRQQLLRDKAAAEKIREVLDDLGLGRSRIAAKGLARNGDGELAPVDAERQRREGMYMMGRLATLRGSVLPIAELHADVTEKGSELLKKAGAAGLGARPARTQPAQIAIVGMACLLPGAQDPETLWRNLLQKKETITEIPAHRWDWRLLYSPDPKQPDKSISKWGGFLSEVAFDPLRYGIPPNSMKSLSTSQLLTLEVVRWALADAGYEDGAFDRENTAVIIGAGANGDLEQQFIIRSALPFLVANPGPEVWQRLPEWTEESFAGVLANVTAGRVANRFDLGGANYTVDAACASSLTVVDLALSELRTGRSNMVVAAGLDLEQTPYFYEGFSRVQAFSPRGKVRAFDQEADGIVISEGVVVVLLKRLADAERDGDKIYAVIQSAAGSSDGKGLGMTAPRSIGQRRALRRAYEEAGCSPAAIGLYEAHGTGTPVGDRAELETVVAVLEESGASAKSCAVGSAKSLIGHTKAAAGMVGLVKAALALHYRTLPPHAHVDRPLPALADQESPVYVQAEPLPWLHADGQPLRAGVSAFGFGGTNFHAVVEEYRGRVEPQAPGEGLWPWELLVWRAAGREALIADLRRLSEQLRAAPVAAAPRLADLACSLALQAEERRSLPVALAIVADSVERAAATAATVAARLEAGEADPVGPLGHLAWETAPAAPVAFLFPGQGAQAPGMARESTLYLPELRAALEQADRVTAGRFDRPLRQLVFPPSAFDEEEALAQRRRIDDTHVAQPAIGAVSCGYLDFVRRVGLVPAMAAGHSYGELTALHAAGALTREDFLRLSELRGSLMAGAGKSGAGAMAAVQLSAEEVEARLAAGAEVVIANRNAPDQCVLSGPREAVAAVIERLTGEGVRVHPLPVSGAFHSPQMAGVEQPLAEAIARCAMAPPAIPVYANATAEPYGDTRAAVVAQLSGHLRSAVDFLGQVRRMYADGARVFVEVGPGRTLTGMVQRILGDLPHTAVALDSGGWKGLLQSLGHLWTVGVPVDLQALFAGRPVARLDLEALVAATPLPASVWMVDGGRVRRPEEKVGTMGHLPLLDLEAVERARREAPAPVVAPQPPVAPAPPVRQPGGGVALEAYRAYQETMRQFLAVQENVMASLLGRGAVAQVPLAPPAALPVPLPEAAPAAPEPISASLPAAALAAAPPAEPAPPSEAPPLAAPLIVDRDHLAATVVGLVSERTGYPAEMLDLDQDIEADLGIDSIKRIEILDAFRKRLPDPLRSAADEHVAELVREKSLGGWVDTVLDLARTDAAPRVGDAPQPVAPSANEEPGAPAEPCPRLVVHGRLEDLDDANAVEPTGLFLITADELGVAPLVAEELRRCGASAVILDRRVLSTAGAPDLERLVSSIVERQGRLQGLVHLAPLASWVPPSPPATGEGALAAWRRSTQIEVKALFDLLRLAEPAFAGAESGAELCVLGATLLGGAYGRGGNGGPGSPAAGGVYGLLKTLSTEYPAVLARVVDFDSSLDPAAMAGIVVRELLSRGGGFEVGYAGGRRTVFHPEPAAVARDAFEDFLPQPGWVVLITGGARGITAELARRLAAPGVRMVVVGRSPLDPEEEAGAADPADLRIRLLERARAAGDAVTPAVIEERLRSVLRQREMHRNLAALRERGAEVEYVAADVSAAEALSSLIDGIYARHGRLDAVLHGAGVIEDRLLRDKTRQSFERVFDTKADSAFLLGGALRAESLRWVVLMSSISGRIGNRGQIDYAAANEVMNRLAWDMARRFPAARVVAINWGPWKGAGMASDAVIRELERRGIHSIGVEAGWRFLCDELAAGRQGSVEVIAGHAAPNVRPAGAGRPAVLAEPAAWSGQAASGS